MLVNKVLKNFFSVAAIMLFFAGIMSCSKHDDPLQHIGTDSTKVTTPYDINRIKDTYPDVAPLHYSNQWGPYNTHDPSIIKEGEYFYSYSTDAAYGVSAPAGIQIRRSKDLIEWQFAGWAFNGLPAMGANFIRQNNGEPFNSLWAPYIIKVGSEFRLYYSLSSPTPRLSVIGLATASSPTGPWTEKGLVVTSLADNRIQTNAIDPTVVVDPSGNHWLYYGSAWDGIYVLKLDPTTGLAAVSGDKGRRIAQRGFTGDKINGNIEGPEIIYNSDLKKYYLFIAYDWLETKYNVRVGRSDSPEGPFYDFHGNDLNGEADNGPMILAPYRFEGHGGWQGVSHPAVFKDDEQYFMAHQGRPGVDKYFMVMHVRRIVWTEDGWPVVSPERYAGIKQAPVTREELVGDWEQIVLNYRVVPGYAAEQLSPDFQVSVPLKLNEDATINAAPGSQWSYNAPWLELKWSNGQTDKVHVSWERDWESNKEKTLVFTGLNNIGIAVWGKKK
jgi:arabinan endo-1,5-alpha-L-arabinosidase